MKTRIEHINEICLWRNKDGTLTRTEQFVDYPLDDDGNRGDPDVETISMWKRTTVWRTTMNPNGIPPRRRKWRHTPRPMAAC